MIPGRQLTLELDMQASFSKESFFVSDSNRHGYAFLNGWPLWPKTRGVFLWGGEGSGKTHLAHLWAYKAGAVFLSMDCLMYGDMLGFVEKNPCLVLEDLPLLKGDQEKPLFHLLNAVQEQQGALLLTSSLLPAELNFTLPDLVSRLKAMPFLSIEQPDDGLREAILYKRFSDLQMKPSKDVISYILKHSERSFSALHHIIDGLNQICLRHQRRLTVLLVKEFLEKKEGAFM